MITAIRGKLKFVFESCRFSAHKTIRVEERERQAPMNRTLNVEAEDHHPIAVLHLSGHCANFEVYKLKTETEWRISDGKRFLILDLTDLAFVDSAGIGVMIQVAERCRSIGAQAAFVCPEGLSAISSLRKTAATYGFDLYDNVESAIAGISAKYGLGLVGASEETSAQMDELKAKMRELENRLKAVEDRLGLASHD